jgi:GTP diphosphokinase / guanosine-3',5'-bis(diphosphate) 3'-diphosphatase
MQKELETHLREKKISFDGKVLKKALDLANRAHKDQKRGTGEDYITHPLAVAIILADMGLDFNTIVAGLLHDVIEDGGIDPQEIEDQFGVVIRKLVEGVTKLKKIEFSKEYSSEVLSEKEEIEIENFRKFFLAVARDLRVVFIKLADRLHNLKTLEGKSPESRRRIAKETLEIYAPLSDRLGMGQLKVDLEDLSFKYYLPEEFDRVSSLVKDKIEDRKKYIITYKNKLGQVLSKAGIKIIRIEGRPKHLYSIYKKLKKTDGDIEKLYDLMAIRIIVREVSDCYKALGIIHQEYKPLIYRIKDYIAVPKPNGYQSLHTTVFGLNGTITEIQIRTSQMHQEAEMGIAAHWHYDQAKGKLFGRGGKKASFAPSKELDWVKQLIDVQRATDSNEFVESLRIDFFQDRIFVFSPKGDIFNLPDGATPVDFAYHVHSEVGHKCIGAKVNGKIVNLDKRLENRDIVEILVSKKAHPNRNWLNFVATSQAKQHIRSWLKKQSAQFNQRLGEETLLNSLKTENLNIELVKDKKVLEELRCKNLEELFVQIGEGNISVQSILRKIISAPKQEKKITPKKTPTSVIKGAEGLRYRLANCCQPQIGDKIIGYVTQGQGISIHKANCKNISRKNSDKLITVCWQEGKALHHIPVSLKAKNRIGLFKDITSLLADTGINILHVRTKQEGDVTTIDMNLEIEDLSLLPLVMTNIKGINDVYEIKRYG